MLTITIIVLPGPGVYPHQTNQGVNPRDTGEALHAFSNGTADAV
jgi:hypothetical protein